MNPNDSSLPRPRSLLSAFHSLLLYLYILTPAGIKSRIQLSRDFLKRKLDEYEMLKMEIEELMRDLG